MIAVDPLFRLIGIGDAFNAEGEGAVAVDDSGGEDLRAEAEAGGDGVADGGDEFELVAAVADVRMRVNDLLDAIPLLERNLVHSNEQHCTVVETILDRDPIAARQAMEDHLSGTAALLRAFLP